MSAVLVLAVQLVARVLIVEAPAARALAAPVALAALVPVGPAAP